MTKEELFQLPILPPDEALQRRIRQNWDNLTKPIDGLGDFETVICRIGAILGQEYPNIDHKAVVVMCADHDIVEEGISQTGKEVTAAVAALLGTGSSTLNRLAARTGARIVPVDVGIDGDRELSGVVSAKVRRGARNFLKTKALTESETLAAIEAGMQLAARLKDEGFTLIASGEMGIGNTTSSAALLCLLTGKTAEALVGRGAGLSDEGLARKLRVVQKAVELYRKDESMCPELALEYLCDIGGLDVAALAGLMLGGAVYHIPVVIDGVITAAAALLAETLKPGVKDYLLPSHSGRERGTATVLNQLGLRPFLNGEMALGEGTGAVMLFPLLDMAMDLYREGSPFSQTEIRAYERFQ